MKFSNNFVGVSDKIKLSIKIFLILIILIYFIFHLLNGKHGLRSYFAIKKEITIQTELSEKLKKEKGILEKNVALLSNKTLDIDILEERCRIVLGYAFTDDIVIKEEGILKK